VGEGRGGGLGGEANQATGKAADSIVHIAIAGARHCTSLQHHQWAVAAGGGGGGRPDAVGMHG
jgi:hypothetical protein